MDQTEAEYFASRAQQCRSASTATGDPATAFAERELALRYDEWSRASARKAAEQSESSDE